MKIDYCLHTHTDRCGHARGTDEEFVLAAINAGIKVLGFSDHVFLPGIDQPSVRGRYEDLYEYIESISYLKEKYKDQIEIHIGFECEYFKEFDEYYRSLLKDFKIEYLILGQHFIMEHGELVYLRNELGPRVIDIYYSYLEEGIKTGMFLYLAHPDLFFTVLDEYDEYAVQMCEKICKLCKEYNVPIEINLNGMTWTLPNKKGYPDERFWEIASKFGNDVVIGYDAHWPEFFQETKYMDYALEIVKKYNLKLINKDELIKKIK